jgi:phosphoenolpyruvate carboxykinase (GTP)
VPLVFESTGGATACLSLGHDGLRSDRRRTGGLGDLRRGTANAALLRLQMGDYFGHWSQHDQPTGGGEPPRIYGVNWFRKDADGKFLWLRVRRELLSVE